jgi:hypothetical protein
MTLFLYAMILLHVLGMLARIATVGRERKPVTTNDAVFLTLIDMAIIYGFLTVISALNGGR